MQNGKTIKTRKNVEFNVDIFKAGRQTVFSWLFFAACVMIRNADIVFIVSRNESYRYIIES